MGMPSLGRRYNNAFRFDGERAEKHSVGLGGNISKSLFALRACDGVTDIPPFYEAQGEDAGNGSIMRLSPVPVMFHADVKIAEEVAVAQSRGTHPGNDAAASCRFITFFIIQAIKLGCPKPQTTGTPPLAQPPPCAVCDTPTVSTGCPTTTRWSNGGMLLVVAQGQGCITLDSSDGVIGKEAHSERVWAEGQGLVC